MGNYISQLGQATGVTTTAQLRAEKTDCITTTAGATPAGYSDYTARLADLGLHLPHDQCLVVRDGSQTAANLRDALTVLGAYACAGESVPQSPEDNQARVEAVALLVRLGVLDSVLAGASTVSDNVVVMHLPDSTPEWIPRLMTETQLAVGQQIEAGEIDGDVLERLKDVVLGDISSQDVRQMVATSPLHFAVLNEDIDALQKLLSDGVRPDALDERGRTALHAAALKDHPLIINLLLKAGADPNRKDAEGRSPLVMAVKLGSLKAVNALVRAGASLDDASYRGFTPLALAALCSELQVMERLLTAGADPNHAGSAGSPVHHAVLTGNPKVLDMLLKRGADPRTQSSIGACYLAAPKDNALTHEFVTPIESAAVTGQLRMVNTLLRHGVGLSEPTPSGVPLLHRAAAGGNVDILNMVLAANGQINETDKMGRTAIHWAAGKGKVEAFKRLLAKGADPFIADRHGNGILHSVASGSTAHNRDAKLEILEMLLGMPQTRVDVRNSDSETPLLIAVLGPAPAIVDALLRAKANPNSKDPHGRSALHRAAMRGDVEIVKRLLKAGAPLHATDKLGNTALHHAARQGRKEAVAALLNSGADAQARTRSGLMASHAAALGGYVDIFNMLLERGVRADAPGPNNRTALEMALARGRKEMADHILALESTPSRQRSGVYSLPRRSA